MYVSVRDNNVDQALRVLKKKMQREGMELSVHGTLVGQELDADPPR